MKSDLDALMLERNLDAVLVMGDAENNPPMYYFVGGGKVSGALLLKKQGEAPILFHGDMERDEAARSGLQTRPLSDFGWQEFMNETNNDTAQAGALRMARILNDYGITRGKVAMYGKVEFSSAYARAAHLAKRLPEVDFVGEGSMDSTLLRAMETKDQAEVERIRRMGSITTEVVGRVADYLTSREVREDEVVLREDGQPLTIGDVKSRINLWLAERGAVDIEGVIFAIGRDAGVPHSTGNPDDPITLGKTIVFDIFPAEKGGGYFYDFTRTWSLGYASDEARKHYDEVKEIYDQVIENLDLNASFRDYHRMTCEYFEARGHKSKLNTTNPMDGYVHSLGHGVGLNIHERPSSGFQTDDDNILKPGVVITIEPGLYYPEKGFGIRIEDTYWVRPDGQVERLAEYPFDFVLEMKNWRK